MNRFLSGLVLLAALAGGPAVHGHGQGHADPDPVAGANAPVRLPDGRVFLPKPAQRQLAVRTAVVHEAPLARSVELAGRVVMDPNAGGKVQAMVPGRLEAGPKGLPSLGQAVRRGEVLAYVVPSAAPLERAGQAAQLAELRAAHTLAGKRLARLRELSDTVPRKEIEAAEAEQASLAARIAAVGGGLAARESLVAPVSGVIAAAHGVAGQVVDARELVYEVVDVTRLNVEALSFDTGLASDVAGASLVAGGQTVALRFAGAARSLREQALPLLFRADGPGLASLAVGQPVKVFVQARRTVTGFAVPAAALVRNPSNQSIVWVKTAPETFEPRVVTVQPLDGANVAVTAGLRTGDRVVVQGAALVNQVR